MNKINYIIDSNFNFQSLNQFFPTLHMAVAFDNVFFSILNNIKIHYIVYSEKAHLIEQNMLTRFNCKKLENNHEVIVDIKLNQLINDVETLMSFLNIEKTIVRQEELEKYNE